MCCWTKTTQSLSDQLLQHGRTSSPTTHHEPNPTVVSAGEGARNPGIQWCMPTEVDVLSQLCTVQYCCAHTVMRPGFSCSVDAQQQACKHLVCKHLSHRAGLSVLCRHTLRAFPLPPTLFRTV